VKDFEDMRFLQHLSPSLYPILSFLVLIILGTAMLMVLPMKEGEHLKAIDALFMATSATCVTGLAVVDIGTQFSTWGQLTILVLIQLGGLGIMTFSTVFALAFGRSISFRSRFLVQDIFSHGPQADLYVLLRRVLLFTFCLEAVGCLLLYSRFREQYDALTAVYYASFHAISAFCNAGFSLYTDSLMRYRSDYLINFTVITLIITGGIGFMVLHDLVRSFEKRESWSHYWNRLSLHTKIVLSMTLYLLIGGTVFFLISEWSNNLRGLSISEKILASFFQSVTPRTAGFNTMDYASMNNVTLLVTIILMFIGASPGSTGGGIKTSTMGVFMAQTRAKMRGSIHAHAYKRSFSAGAISRAFSIFIISTVIIAVGTAGLLISEVGSVSHQASRGQFMELLFETTSAFATVGLSMGVTASLSSVGKFILVLIMFTGRLGPLVIAMAIQPGKSVGRFTYPEERVMIG
jgi:trk system potassium uptake protein